MDGGPGVGRGLLPVLLRVFPRRAQGRVSPARYLGQRVCEALGVAPGQAARHVGLRHWLAPAGLFFCLELRSDSRMDRDLEIVKGNDHDGK